MANTTVMALVCCCFLISMFTVFVTYFANKDAFEHKGAAAGLWIACIFFTFTVIIALVGPMMLPDDSEMMYY
jgi:formate-dependent nitrite reductase membrane component NrfD